MSPTPAQLHRESCFRLHADEHERVSCYFKAEGNCRGPLQSAHIISAQTLKRTRNEALIRFVQGERLPILEFTEDELVGAGANGVPACSAHHHLHEGPVLHCDPPAVFFEWLSLVGLENVWEGRKEPRHIGSVVSRAAGKLNADEGGERREHGQAA